MNNINGNENMKRPAYTIKIAIMMDNNIINTRIDLEIFLLDVFANQVMSKKRPIKIVPIKSKFI